MITFGKKPIKYYLTKEFKDELRQREVVWGYGGLSELTFYRTYSRKKENGKLETWHDCVIRVIEGMFSILKTHALTSHLPWREHQAHKLAEEAANRLFEFKWTPPGRGLWMMGTDYLWERGANALYNCSFVSTTNIDAELSKPFAFVMDMMMSGVGLGYDTDGAGKLVIHKPQGAPELIIVEDTREGWVELISCLIDSYFEEGSSPISHDTHKVRGYGEPIKGFGGVASGPEPLIRGFNAIKAILDSRDGELISSTDIVSIMGIIGKIVVAGNVRRSALLALGQPEDIDYVTLKNWDNNPVGMGIMAPEEMELENPQDYADYNNPSVDFSVKKEIAEKYMSREWSWKLGGWLWASNNSLYAKTGMDYSSFVDSIAQNGEPGFFWLDTARSYGRLKDPISLDDSKVKGLNPCVAGHTLVDTSEGLKTVEELVGTKFTAIVNGQPYKSTEQGFWSTGVKPTFRITLSNGMNVEATDNHQFLTASFDWKELKDLVIGDELRLGDSGHCDIVSIEYVGEQEVYDCTIETVHCFSANGIIAHNCAEIQLESYEVCNLNENYPAKHEDYWDFQRTLKFSYLYSKVVTLLPTSWEETNAVINRNRRIGCSLSGIQELFLKVGRKEALNWFDQAYDYLGYLDKKYSGWLGIPKSIRRSTVKPSGSVSLLAGALPGIHHSESSSYYRTVRIASNSSIIPILEAANYRIEPAASDPTKTSVVYFPILVDEKLPNKSDVSIWRQFKDLADLQKHWSDNAVSITITFTKDEVSEISECLSAFDSEIKSVSLLPYSSHGYVQAPYIAAPREEIIAYADSILPLDFSSLTDEGDNAENNKYCTTDSCEI